MRSNSFMICVIDLVGVVVLAQPSEKARADSSYRMLLKHCDGRPPLMVERAQSPDGSLTPRFIEGTLGHFNLLTVFNGFCPFHKRKPPWQALSNVEKPLKRLVSSEALPTKLCTIGISLGEAQDASPRRQPWDKADA